MQAPVDFLGNTINPGDTICYPVRRGSSMWLNKLRITQVLPGALTGLNEAGRWITVRNTRNVIVVEPAPSQEG
jgi:hypothetical protein